MSTRFQCYYCLGSSPRGCGLTAGMRSGLWVVMVTGDLMRRLVWESLGQTDIRFPPARGRAVIRGSRDKGNALPPYDRQDGLLRIS